MSKESQQNQPSHKKTSIAAIWIDWYPYHVARFIGLQSAASPAGNVVGIELVGGTGVHAGLKFREDLPDGLPVLTLMPGSDWKSAGQFRLARKLWSALNQLDPQIVLVPGYYNLPGLTAAVWAVTHRRQSVLMTESTAEDHVRVAYKEKLKSALIRHLFHWAVTGGSAHRRYLGRLRFPADRVLRFYDVIDNQYFKNRAAQFRRQKAEDFGLPNGYFLYVGRLSEEKHVKGLIDEWEKYRTDGGLLPLVIVGDGPLSNAVRKQASMSSHSPDIHFPGHATYRELPQYYAFATCFVLPSTREPWGLVVNEAMASGLPVLVSNRCGCSEDLVKHGKNGYVFDPTSAGELAALMYRMEQTNPDELVDMRVKSAEIISSYSPLAFGNQISTLCELSLPVTTQ